MSKYAPLGDFLRKQKGALVPMTFAEVERVVGTELPKSRRYPAWWSNNPFNNVMTQVWLDAGFETEQVDVEAEKLVFRRVSASPGFQESSGLESITESGRPHPAIGWMKGTITIAPGVDLTEPADPEWGEVAYGDKTWNDVK
jgi:hypothetical protein